MAFKGQFELFSEDQRAAGYTSADETHGFVLNACKAWHHRPVGTITFPEIKALLMAKRKTAPHAANRLHRHLACYFGWLVKNDVLKNSVIFKKDEPAEAAAEETREFAWIPADKPSVSDDAIKAIWAAGEAIGGDEGKHLELVMITGKRRSAVEYQRWDDIGDDWYRVPRRVVGGKVKPFGTRIKRCHAIPLPKLAQRILSPRQPTGRVFGRC